jgi:exonuclease III
VGGERTVREESSQEDKAIRVCTPPRRRLHPQIVNVNNDKVMGLKILNANVDNTVLNEMKELKTRVSIENPDIICINEFNPKNARNTITDAELKIKGFNTYTSSRVNGEGRGCMIYCKDSLEVDEVDFECGNLYNLKRVKVKANANDFILIGCIYKIH